MRLTSVPIALAVCLAAAGCGQSDARRQVRDVAEAFTRAVQAGDGAAACALLSRFAVEDVEARERAPCERAILALDLSDAPVERVGVAITSAQVRQAGGTYAYLDRARDGWRLTAVGCRFEDGKPRDRPATCEAAA
jgi:hypothetical protein